MLREFLKEVLLTLGREFAKRVAPLLWSWVSLGIIIAGLATWFIVMKWLQMPISLPRYGIVAGALTLVVLIVLVGKYRVELQKARQVVFWNDFAWRLKGGILEGPLCPQCFTPMGVKGKELEEQFAELTAFILGVPPVYEYFCPQCGLRISKEESLSSLRSKAAAVIRPPST